MRVPLSDRLDGVVEQSPLRARGSKARSRWLGRALRQGEEAGACARAASTRRRRHPPRRRQRRLKLPAPGEGDSPGSQPQVKQFWKDRCACSFPGGREGTGEEASPGQAFGVGRGAEKGK